MENDEINRHQQIINSLCVMSLDNFHLAAFRNILLVEIHRLEGRKRALGQPLTASTEPVYQKLNLRVSFLKTIANSIRLLLAARLSSE